VEIDGLVPVELEKAGTTSRGVAVNSRALNADIFQNPTDEP
jgi:hypothetical protein